MTMAESNGERECPECAGLSRRKFLAGALAAGGAAIAASSVTTRVAMAADASYSGDTLVVISLRGGFDGLSAIVPAGDPNYYALRPNISVPQPALLAMDSMFGLHPSMAPLLPHWQAGRLAAVHAVGQPVTTRSHFEATDEMERAAPNSELRTGWVDRALGQRGMTGVFSAIQMGKGLPTKAFIGPSQELTLGSLEDFQLVGTDAANDPEWARAEFARWRTALATMNGTAPPSVQQPTTAALKALQATTNLAKASYSASAPYPKTDLGTAMADVARLVKAGLGVQIACVDVGDWDMHEGLGRYDVADSWMTRKLRDLSESMAAFAADIGTNRMAKTVVVTMSEFGRRVEENASGGVDHGLGNAMLILGGSVVGGRVHGVWPGLERRSLDEGDLAGANDFRVILAEILAKRCRQQGMSTVFPGANVSRPLGVVRA